MKYEQTYHPPQEAVCEAPEADDEDTLPEDDEDLYKDN